MSREIIRVGMYWYPPRKLAKVLEQLWSGELAARYLELARQWKNKDAKKAKRYRELHEACDLVARHCGDCPIWLPHATILDAICIVAEDRGRFVQAMGQIAGRFLPIRLRDPQIREWGWGNNVFLRWEGGHGKGIDRLREFREAVAEKASEFMVVERVAWEAINDTERLLAADGLLARSEFHQAMGEINALLRAGKAPRLPHAPNVGLDWYIDRVAAGKQLRDDKLPFAPDPHISIATGVRADDKYGMTAKEVGDCIKKRLPKIEEFHGLLDDRVVHDVDSVCIVEPAPPFTPPLEVTVVDRPTGRARVELRQPWRPVEELPSGKSLQANITMVWGLGPKGRHPKLMGVISKVTAAIREKLADSRFASVVFVPYKQRHIHATIIGMEVAKVAGRLVNLNFLRRDGVQRAIQPRVLLGLLASLAEEAGDDPIFRVRFGGWPKAHCRCQGDDLLAWECRTGGGLLHTYSRSAYEGSSYISDNGEVMLTGWPVASSGAAGLGQLSHSLYRLRAAAGHSGYLDSYHRADRPDWRDDDFYIRLGTLRNCSDALRKELAEHIRALLAGSAPVIVPVRLADISIVYYRNTALSDTVVKPISAVAAIQRPELVDQLYEQWMRDQV